MKAPRLHRRLMLESPTHAGDGAGGHQREWVAAGVVWAEVRSSTGRGMAAPAAALSHVTHRITMRSSPVGSPRRPVAGQRLREGTRIFHIIAVTEGDVSGRYLTCLAEEEGVR